MKIEELKGKKIAVLGFGVEGEASALYLVEKGAKVTVLDKKPVEELDGEVVRKMREIGNVRVIGGEGYLNKLSEYDVIVRSPGIKRNLPELLAAEGKGVLVTSQTQMFFDLCPCEIIGVTGTKGKGTTSALIYEMLKKQGFDAYLGGNIGKPPFVFLDTLGAQSKVVLELSSFQLEDLGKSPADASIFAKASTDKKAMAGKPHIAVMLMTTKEHLGADTKGTQNYHDTLEDYISAKRNLLRFQKAEDFAILNRDYPASNESDVHTEGKVFQISREREAMDEGCFVADGKIRLKIKDEGLKIREEDVIDIKDILLPGGHNLENACAAVMAATLSGVSKENIKTVLQTFKGLEHRLEFVATVNGVKYYDDSFSTTPETAIAAIHAFKNPEILILGGSRKESDFQELGKVIAHSPNIRAVIGIGVEWQRIKDEVLRFTQDDPDLIGDDKIMMIEGATDMTTIVTVAAKIAQPGDVVLLSPACASFDMFTNYKERGNFFKEEVKKLQQ